MLLCHSHGYNFTLTQLSIVKLWQTTNHKKETEAKGIKQPQKEHQFECFLETLYAFSYILNALTRTPNKPSRPIYHHLRNKKQAQPTHISRVQ